MVDFTWDEVRRDENGKIVLLYRHERVLIEGLVKPGMDVLDVGGWGIFAQRLIEEGAHCTILDLFTPDQHYPERVRALPHVVGDVTNPDVFPAKSFDLVTCFETLEHCGDIIAALKNIRRWLRPKSWLVGTVPMPGFIHHGDPTCTIFNRDELLDALKAVGFVTVSIEPTPSILPTDECISYYFKGRTR